MWMYWLGIFFHSFFISALLAAACFIYSKPTTTDIDCIIQTEKISQAGESDANLQRVRLQDFSAIMVRLVFIKICSKKYYIY